MKRIPANAIVYRRTAEFSESSTPPALRSAHSTRAGVWGRNCVLRGQLRYRILERAPEKHVLSPEQPGVVEPEIRHQVEPIGVVRFYVEFLREPR